jgi:hypothetical protein
MNFFNTKRRRFMKKALVLVALLGLAVSPAMAAPPVEKAAKELATGQKPSQEIQMNNRSTRSMWIAFPWMCMK